MHQGGKAAFPGPPGVTGASTGGYQSTTPPVQGTYNQYGQGYGQAQAQGQGKKNFTQNQNQNQNQAAGGAYSYSTAYPSQVTGGTGASQDYSYEGYNNQSTYNAQGVGNQGYGTNQTQYHNPTNMNYQYR